VGVGAESVVAGAEGTDSEAGTAKGVFVELDGRSDACFEF